jgi:ribonuclease HI
MTERGTSAGKRSGRKTRYHLPTTDGGIVADQLGKAPGEAAIGVVLKAPLEEISEPIGAAKDHHVAEYRALIMPRGRPLSGDWSHTRVPRFRSSGQPAERQVESQGGAPQPLYKHALSLIQQFTDIKITWVPRQANAEADALASTPLGR